MKDIVFSHIMIECNSINFQEIIFNYTYFKLHENVVTFNQYNCNFMYKFTKFYCTHNYLTCNLVTTLAAILLNTKRKKTDDGISQPMDGQFNRASQRDDIDVIYTSSRGFLHKQVLLISTTENRRPK